MHQTMRMHEMLFWSERSIPTRTKSNRFFNACLSILQFERNPMSWIFWGPCMVGGVTFEDIISQVTGVKDVAESYDGATLCDIERNTQNLTKAHDIGPS